MQGLTKLLTVLALLASPALVLSSPASSSASKSSFGAATGPGPCHPFPGAVASDCLELIGSNWFNFDDETSCDARTGRATISLRNCAITTACAEGVSQVSVFDATRRALQAIGTCATSDLGSISGYFVADDGSKTCYLYPGREADCTI
ncbi:hypothetical protein LshimejAT787_1800910 [Lyophyllum shimeji]|uniref:Uncharacterized protein n=1 Tax=Lyophyllum shimeji TaxID=47721 RepID=A0A9P3UR70_LYOSH|nr:hypothetical protein LshimejAT787_1800910 [Lyophyllum shimeji]